MIPGKSPHATARPDAALIKAVARGYGWYEKLASGQVASLIALAKQVGVNKRYVSRVVRASLLAPDIVETILEGQQPPEITVEHLFDHLPMDWAEQRRMFGLLDT